MGATTATPAPRNLSRLANFERRSSPIRFLCEVALVRPLSRSLGGAVLALSVEWRRQAVCHGNYFKNLAA